MPTGNLFGIKRLAAGDALVLDHHTGTKEKELSLARLIFPI
jgi:hypothetical protein